MMQRVILVFIAMEGAPWQRGDLPRRMNVFVQPLNQVGRILGLVESSLQVPRRNVWLFLDGGPSRELNPLLTFEQLSITRDSVIHVVVHRDMPEDEVHQIYSTVG
jgi:hypothetical protein